MNLMKWSGEDSIMTKWTQNIVLKLAQFPCSSEASFLLLELYSNFSSVIEASSMNEWILKPPSFEFNVAIIKNEFVTVETR